MRNPSIGSRRRRGYHRQGGVYVKPTDVPGVMARIKRKGPPGRGPVVITGLKKGAMTQQAIKLGYIEKGQGIGDIPKSKMDDFAIELAKKVGTLRAQRMINALLVFRKQSDNGFKDKLLVAKTALSRKSKVLKVQR